MTTHVVADETLGKISKRMWEVQRRLMEGTLDPEEVARNLQLTAEGRQIILPDVPEADESPFFAGRQVASTWDYPPEFTGIKPFSEQAAGMIRWLPNLDPAEVLKASGTLQTIDPSTGFGWGLFPKLEKLGKTPEDGMHAVIAALKKAHNGAFCDYREKWDNKHYRIEERTLEALAMLGRKQKGDFVWFPFQFGLKNRGKAVQKVRYNYASREFGLDAILTGVQLLAHLTRLVRWEQLHIDCPAGQYDPEADGSFPYAPCFVFRDGGVRLRADGCGVAGVGCGSVSGLLPQTLEA